MKYYVDITLLPDTDVGLGFIWQKVYQQVHLLLADKKISEHNSAIGLSFPEYGSKIFPLGDKLRLFAETKEMLTDLNLDKWLNRVSDYVHIKSIKPVPDGVSEFAFFKRKQFKSPEKTRKSIDIRARAISEKNGLEFEDVKGKLLSSIDNLDTHCKLPFINLKSLSSSGDSSVNKRFLLFIEFQKTESKVRNNPFTCYGLSRRTPEDEMPVPWF